MEYEEKETFQPIKSSKRKNFYTNKRKKQKRKRVKAPWKR